MSKEKAELLNDIMNIVYLKNHLTDLDGKYDLSDPFVSKALRGLAEKGYINLQLSEDNDNIHLIIISQNGFDFMKRGGKFN